MDGWGMGNGWMWLFGLLVLVGLVLVAVAAVRLLGGGAAAGGPEAGPPPARARELLDERYARGEISTEEYRERRRALDEDG